MTIHIENRDLIMKALREEHVGPSEQGQEIDCNQDINFEDFISFYKPWRQKGSGEEILQRDSPVKRYGVGVLYPVGSYSEKDENYLDIITNDSISSWKQSTENVNESEVEGEVVTDEGFTCLDEITNRFEKSDDKPDPNELDITSANKYRQSSIGVSFFAVFPEGSKLIIEVPTIDKRRGYRVNGRYSKIKLKAEDKEREWWLRKPVSILAEYSAESINNSTNRLLEPSHYQTDNIGKLDLKIEVFSRSHGAENGRFITVCLVKRKEAAILKNEDCLFQAYFIAYLEGQNEKARILPYPSQPYDTLDLEEKSLELLYRNSKTYAVGHGCAADWDTSESSQTVKWVSAECMPFFETPSITPDIRLEDGPLLEISMKALAGLDDSDDGFSSLANLITVYEKWINSQEKLIKNVEDPLQEAAEHHIKECKRSLIRMTEGLDYLKCNPKAKRAFELANHAMLLQQASNRREPRWASFDSKSMRLDFSEPYVKPIDRLQKYGKGKWRAFQAAFLLMSIKSTVESGDIHHDTVDLIWFPTGGGKTEAYLGLAAFAIFLRRTKNIEDSGVHVLMRYTLRLLTAQQFLRASSLLCAMEHLRRIYSNELGKEEFSIGLWLGGETTPNKRSEATKILSGLMKGDKRIRNKFILNRCPWCGAQFGAIRAINNKTASKKRKKTNSLIGYELSGGSVSFNCPETHCEFNKGLPVYVIDEDIYDKKPSLVIGTIDKFAMLAWRPEARALFGIDNEGSRVNSPPGLIIQDELHLISGPLGSLSGLYETVIEELCTDRRQTKPKKPKIICSTATIRRYSDQVKALYGRLDTSLFPPPGIDISDSFFSRYATKTDGTPYNGRIYLGIHAPGLGSLQTAQVRSFASLLQAPMELDASQRDPWWTLLAFFNSLRELGTTLSLFQSDIPDYLRAIKNRLGLNYNELRSLYRIEELTGRLREDEIPEAIAALETCYSASSNQAVDTCLASSIIEVGIDIDRLSLMTVLCQPKTTSQYIQVTGRVGRKWWERPGLIVTIYSASRPRDRSFFEKFRSYHERLYAQVEPTSLTPFSPPVLDRALHSVMVTYVRQLGNINVAESPYPYPGEMLQELKKLLIPRIKTVDPDELANFEKVFEKRVDEWKQWERTRWQGDIKDTDIPLMRVSGSYAGKAKARVSWPTQMSMRNVDATCEAEITLLYLGGDGEQNA